MAILGKYLAIDDVQLPNPIPGSFEYQLNPSENLFENEAGEQMSNVKRLDRLSWSGTFQCTSGVKEALLLKCKNAECVCTFQGISHQGRLRLGGGVSLYELSEYVPGTLGLWTVPLVFEEF